ncbi:MAG: hypothetical protein JNM56_18675 [Planctomycetia bacterium]|nr:hypothetical protein [Planctomycetia bacterium]
MVRKVLCGAGIGAVIGLFIVFMAFIGTLTATTVERRAEAGHVESREKLQLQRSEASFQNMTRDEWLYKQKEPDHILGRISISQARSGDIDSAAKNIGELKKLDQDIVRNVAVHEMLHRVVQYGKVDQPEQKLKPVLEKARTVAGGIKDPLLKADALRRIADVQEQYMEDTASKDQARAAYAEAAKLVLNRPVEPEQSASWFNPWLLLWPAGLAIFAAMLLALLMPLLDMAAFARKPSKITAEDEGIEDEDDEDEKPAAPVVEVPVAEAPVAEVPDAELTAPPAEEVPMAADMPMADVPMAGDMAMAEMPAAAAPAPPSKMMTAAAQQPGAPAPGGNPDKKTMMARSGQPAAATMLAKGAAAQTMLVKGGTATKLADSDEAMPLPDATRKTVKK